MDGKKLVIGILTAMFLLLAFVFWMGMTGGSQHIPGAPSPFANAGATGATNTGAPSMESDPSKDLPSAEKAASRAVLDAGPITETLHDKAARDEVRRRILLAWAQGDSDEHAPADIDKRPMPERDGGVDPDYIRDVVRSEFTPLVGSCYESLLKRQDAGGTVDVSFTIVGDEKIGGIVEEAEVSSDAGLGDDEFQTCLRESMASVAFRPPPHGGKVTVRYPFELAP